MPVLPSVTFLVKSESLWLSKKRDFLEKKWQTNNDGLALMKRLTASCKLSFPKKVESIEVTLEPYYRCGGLLGFTSMDSPSRITLYVKKRTRYLDLKLTLCHELIHSLCWCNTTYDGRRTATSFFADVFADELLTTMLEHHIVKRKLSKEDYEWALDYARSVTCEKLKNLKKSKNYEDFIDELNVFFTDYKKDIKNGKTNILLERQRMLRDIMSSNDS